MAAQTPCPPGARRLPVDERRAHLLDLGIELFGEMPYDQLSTDELGVGVGEDPVGIDVERQRREDDGIFVDPRFADHRACQPPRVSRCRASRAQ